MLLRKCFPIVLMLLAACPALAAPWVYLDGETASYAFTTAANPDDAANFSSHRPACQAIGLTFTTSRDSIVTTANQAAGIDIYQCRSAGDVPPSANCRLSVSYPTGGPIVRPMDRFLRLGNGEYFRAVVTQSPGGGATASVSLGCLRDTDTAQRQADRNRTQLPVASWTGEIIHGNLTASTRAIIPPNPYRTSLSIFALAANADTVFWSSEEGGHGSTLACQTGIGIPVEAMAYVTIPTTEGAAGRSCVGAAAGAFSTQAVRVFESVAFPNTQEWRP